MDWVALRFPPTVDPREALPGGADLPWEELETGGYGRPRTLLSGKMRVHHDPERALGPYLALSGKACREAEARGVVRGEVAEVVGVPLARYGVMDAESSQEQSPPVDDWPAYARWATAKGAECARVDIAMDDRAGILDLDVIERAWNAGEVTSRWRTMDPRRPTKKGGKVKGRSLYFGSRQSDVYLRIYDKAMEQGLPEGTHWIRVEMEFKGDRAGKLWRAIGKETAEGLGASLRELLMGYLCFRKPGRSRRERCDTAPWWAAFCEHVAAQRLGADPKLPTLIELYAHISRQYAPSIALLTHYFGGDMRWLLDLQVDGRARWKPRHLAMRRRAA